jgi:NAD(P)H dehydrogenase (quinone)
MSKIALILGHPDARSFCASLAQTYAQAALAHGHELQWIKLHEMDFDPTLHHGYRQIQALEPSLLQAQQTLAWADRWVIVYPIWWGGMPALLKGFFDRVLLPGFAFKYRSGSALWDKLMRGKSAQLIVTQDTPPWYFRWVYGRPGHLQMKRTILGFCGVAPIHLKEISPVRGSSLAQREKWLAQVSHLAKK